MVNQEYFNSLLEGLQTEESRIAVIVEAVKKDITNDPKHIKTVFEYFEKQNDIVNLGVQYDRIGNHTYALRLYKEKLQEMENNRSIEINKELKNLTRTQEVEITWSESTIANLSGRIALLSKRCEENEEAEKFYTKALQIFEEIGEFKYAADLAEEMGDAKKAENYKSLDSLLNPKCF